ncbi:XrtA/PEP-CTERM system TPR-repeat protein PrsT [Massilia sp. TSP1-1-2]|uniref:XrtA/PEP-CTERM system TPR-repeat protein PrsT n=1 Tax=Massilia sp. TSP1-1-2 TaxID=2804649 RepID=UPI003CE6BA9C
MPRNAHKLTLTAALVSSAVLLATLGGCHRADSAATLVGEAKSYQQKGDNKAALIQWKNAAAKSPEDATIRLSLGALYNEMGDSASAEKELRKAASLGAPAAQVLPGLATALLGQGEFQKLVTETDAAAASAGAPLLVQRGNAFLALNQPDKAKEAFEAALKAKPDDSAALLGLASHAFTIKDTEAGERYAAQALAKDGKNPDVWMFKAMLATRQGKQADALAAYDQVLALRPAHRSAHLEKAYLEIGMGKFDLAKADIDAAKKTTPNSLIVTYTQALLDFTQGKNEVALEAVQKVLRSVPEHMPSVLLSGAIELNLGQLEQAEQHLKKYLEKFPDTLYARKLLATTQLRAAHPDEAAATLAPALKLPSEDPQLLALAGESFMQAREFGKAEEYFTRAAVLAPKAAALRTSLGMSKLAQGQKEQAVTEMELATTLDPKSQAAGITLVRTALGMKQYDKALAAVLALEKEQPDNALVQNMKGGVHLSRSDMPAARTAFARAAQLQPSYFAPVSNLAQMDLADKKPEDARKRLEAFVALDKKNIAAMTALAELSGSQGNMPQALVWLERAAAENPDTPEPGMRLAAYYMKSGDKAKALTLVRKLQVANPTNPELADMLGQAQVANNDAAGALETYSKLAALLPKSAKPQLRLASVHRLLKNEALAADDIKRAIALEPANVQAKLALVDLELRRGKPDEALAVVHRLQKEEPSSAVYYAVEGDLLQAQKKPELALKSYQQAYGLAKSAQLMLKVNQALRQNGKAKEADVQLTQYLKDKPGEPAVMLYAAETQLAAKQYKAAIANFEAILKRSPDNPLVLNNLAWAYQQEKDPRALPTAEQANKIAPDNAALMDTLGWMLVEQGDVKRGLPLLEKAAAKAPQANDIRYHLAGALNKSGDKARARKELDKALADGKPFAQMDEARALLKQL